MQVRLDTRQGVNPSELARIVSNCLDLHTFCPFLTVFGRTREADQPDVLSGLGVWESFGRTCGKSESRYSGFQIRTECNSLALIWEAGPALNTQQSVKLCHDSRHLMV